jgi:hypothetical protein
MLLFPTCFETHCLKSEDKNLGILWTYSIMALESLHQDVLSIGAMSTAMPLAKNILLILLRRHSHRNELAKQPINDDCCGGAKSVIPCWQDNNQSEKK